MSVRTLRPTSGLDVAASAVPAGAATWSALLLAPLFDLASMPVAALAGLVTFASGLALMRLASRREASFGIRAFRPSELEDELVLDQPVAESAADPVAKLAELLLDDPLPVAAPDLRVVQLFPPQAVPSPEELKRRIDRHLVRREVGPASDPGPDDASDSLRLALEDLRRTLAGRQVTR